MHYSGTCVVGVRTTHMHSLVFNLAHSIAMFVYKIPYVWLFLAFMVVQHPENMAAATERNWIHLESCVHVRVFLHASQAVFRAFNSLAISLGSQG